MLGFHLDRNCFFVELGHEIMGVALLSVLDQVGQGLVNKGSGRAPFAGLLESGTP
jgi:hypothetical protein